MLINLFFLQYSYKLYCKYSVLGNAMQRKNHQLSPERVFWSSCVSRLFFQAVILFIDQNFSLVSRSFVSFVKTHSKNIFLFYYPPLQINKKVFVCPGHPFSPSWLFPYMYLRNISFTTQKEMFCCVDVNIPWGAKVPACCANSIEDII